MHLHCHLTDCIKNFGSIYSFWLFSFERYNGMLGAIPSNRKNIEVQLMTKFLLTDSLLTGLKDMPDACTTVLEPLLTNKPKLNSVLADWEITNVPNSRVHFCVKYWSYLDHITPSKMRKICYFNNAECRHLLRTYQQMYPDSNIELHDVTTNFWKYSHIYVGQQHFGSESYASTDRYSMIMASWVNDLGKIDYDPAPRPAIVKHYCNHTLMQGGEFIPHMFAYVEWPIEINENAGHGLLKPISVWNAKKNLRRSEASFIPVQRIQSKAACA
jgi:hypothetical protein